MSHKIENGAKVWKGWEPTKDGVFRKYYKKEAYIDACYGFFWAYNKEKHCIGNFHTLKEAEEALKGK
jgi:hypothetical protein